MDRKVFLACLLIVAGTISWRSGAYFSGAFDVVVLLKAILAGLALVVAASARPAQDGHNPPWLGAVWFVGVYVCVSALGAWGSGDLQASGILAMRLLLTAAVIFALARAYPGVVVIEGLATAMVAVGVVSAATGVSSLGSGSGRLVGGVPPLTPNEISLLCGIGLLFIIWRCLTSGGRWYHFSAIAGLFAIFWVTGSRTGLTVLLGAVVLMIVQVRRMPVGAFVVAVGSVPLLFYTITSTSLVGDYVGRGGAQSISTLSSRTIAWRAAIELPDTWWESWFGSGLAVKRIAVPARWWSEQVLDSSVVSALVQTGIVGVLLLLLWTVTTVSRAVRAPAPERLLWTSLLAFVVVRSILESGLFDATPAFLVFFLIALVAGPALRPSASIGAVPARREKRLV
jgi:hypothetical protein